MKQQHFSVKVPRRGKGGRQTGRRAYRRRARRRRKRMRTCALLGALALCAVLFFGGFRLWRAGSADALSDAAAVTAQPQASVEEAAPRAPQPWNLILVNRWNALPKGFSVNLFTLPNEHQMDSRIYGDYQAMIQAAKEEGLSIVLASSYRSLERQQELFSDLERQYLSQGMGRREAKEEAAKLVAVPGTSEHHTGLALDLVSAENQNLTPEQEDTPEQQWLMKNAHLYGFVLRFPNGRTETTGISYEPWHYRYVGREAAEEMHRRNLCLEEYLEEQGW